MDDFNPVGHREKNDLQSPNSRNEPPKEEKRNEKVIEGTVIRKKKSLGSKIRETFFGSDADSVMQYVVFDVVVPAIKDTVVEVVTQGVERMFWGEAHRYSRRGGRTFSRAPESYVSYRGYSSRGNDGYRSPDHARRNVKENQRRRRHNMDNIIFSTRVEAQEVLERLENNIIRYDAATVADLYELVGEDTIPYTDENWGWYDLRNAGIRKVSEGYLLDVPNPEPLS